MASVVIPGGKYSRIQVTGVIEWGKISKPKKIPKASNKHYPPSPPPKKKKKNIHAEFPSLKNLQKVLNIKRAAKHWTAETSLVLYFILRTTRLDSLTLPRILRLIWICPNKIPTWIKPTKKYCHIFLPKKSRNRTQKTLPDQSLVCSEEAGRNVIF